MSRLSANLRSSMEGIQVGFLRRLLRSRLGLRLARAYLAAGVPYKPHQKVSADFFLQILQSAYAGRSTPVVWTNIFVPSELMWGLGVVPFYPETVAGLAASLGLTPVSLKQADMLGYAIDLCTVHRSAAGLRAAGLYPRADAYVSTSNVCDLAGQMLAGFAHQSKHPFYFLDVPQQADEASVDYLAHQLKELVDRLTAQLGIRYDPERLRQALRLSNQARELALNVAALREAVPAPLRGSDMRDQLGMITAIFGNPAGVTYYATLENYARSLQANGQVEQANQKVRLYWMYVMPYFPTELLTHLEDDLGVVLAFEEISTVWWDRLDEADPLRSLARKVISLYFNGPIEQRIKLAESQVSRYNCSGAIHFSHWGCRQSSGGVEIVRRHLRRAGVPLLVLDGDCIDPTNLQMGPLRTRIEAFVEMLA